MLGFDEIDSGGTPRMWHCDMRIPFCEHHVSTREDDGTGSDTTCAAHLSEGLAFECPYGSISEAKVGEFPCVDADPIG